MLVLTHTPAVAQRAFLFCGNTATVVPEESPVLWH